MFSEGCLFCSSITKACIYENRWTLSTSLISGSESHYTLYCPEWEFSFASKMLSSSNKDASPLKASRSTMNLNPPTHPPSLFPSHCNLSCQLPRFVFGSDPSPSVEQSHFMFTSAPEAFLPAHYPCFLLSAKWIPIKSTVLQLEFGRIYLAQRSKSQRLSPFSHVAPFHGVGYRRKWDSFYSWNRILLGFFVFFCLFNMLIEHLAKCL